MALTIKDFRLFTLTERQQTVFNKNANTHKNTNRLLLPPELPPELVDRAKVFAQSARDFNDARRVRLYQGVGWAICGRHCRVRGQRLARYFWTGHRKNDASVRSVGLFARGHA